MKKFSSRASSKSGRVVVGTSDTLVDVPPLTLGLMIAIQDSSLGTKPAYDDRTGFHHFAPLLTHNYLIQI